MLVFEKPGTLMNRPGFCTAPKPRSSNPLSTAEAGKSMSKDSEPTRPSGSVSKRLVSIRDFIRCDISGVFDYPASKEAISGIVASWGDGGVTDVLVDTRDAVVMEVSASDVFSLLMHFLSLKPDPAVRVAILNDPKDELDRAKIFAEGAVVRGRTVAAFREFESAMEWLNEGHL
jgi:hypothetical protein